MAGSLKLGRTNIFTACMLFQIFCWPALLLADEVYLTKEEALRIILGEGCEIRYEKRHLDEAALQALKGVGAAPEGAAESHIFTCLRGGVISGYAFIDQQIGKHAPITFIVGIDPNGKVSGSEIMVYREHYGSQVKDQEFLSQFKLKTSTDPLRVGHDIKHVTGATLSSLAIAKGVKRELLLWNMFFARTKDA